MEDASVGGLEESESKGRRSRQARADALREAARKARAEATEEMQRLRKVAAELDEQAAQLERTERARRSKKRSQDERRIGRAIVAGLTDLVRGGDARAQELAGQIANTLDPTAREMAMNLLGLPLGNRHSARTET